MKENAVTKTARQRRLELAHQKRRVAEERQEALSARIRRHDYELDEMLDEEGFEEALLGAFKDGGFRESLITLALEHEALVEEIAAPPHLTPLEALRALKAERAELARKLEVATAFARAAAV